MTFESLRRKYSVPVKSDEEIVASAVRDELRELASIKPRRIEQAAARAVRAMKVSGCSPKRCVERAVAWAVSMNDEVTPHPAASEEGASCSN